jgi:phosphatidylinositol glycan class Q protein
MVTRNGLMRIFWPSDAPTGLAPAVLVGFRNSDLDLFVVAVLQDVESPYVENMLSTGSLLRHDTHYLHELIKRCHHSSLRVLGCVNPHDPPIGFDASRLAMYTDTLTRFPRLYCPADIDMTLQVIVYDRPHPTHMQYISLSPMSLALGDKTEAGRWTSSLDGVEEDGQRASRQKEKLLCKLRLHTVIVHPTTHKDLSLSMVVDQINCSFELDAVLQKNLGVLGRRLKRTMSVSEHMAKSANNLWDYVLLSLSHIWSAWLYPVAARLIILGVLFHRATSEITLSVLDWRPGSIESPALKDISATAQQVDIRLQQSCYWPVQYWTLQRRRRDWDSISSSYPEYIRFYNSLWLVANDVIIGFALGSYIVENYLFVAAQVDTVFTVWSIEGLRQMISWLMEWPGGLKLNTELAEFMGDLFLWVIDYWAGPCIFTNSAGI